MDINFIDPDIQIYHVFFITPVMSVSYIFIQFTMPGIYLIFLVHSKRQYMNSVIHI